MRYLRARAENDAPIENHQIAEALDLLIWDWPVRAMHGIIIAGVATAWASRKSSDWFAIHEWSGYVILIVVLTRIVWGVLGTYHARFANFVRAPSAVLDYARKLVRGESECGAGHNPLGALMVLLLLSLLLAQALTGLAANDQVVNAGPFSSVVSGAVSDRLTAIHRVMSRVLLMSILLHVVAIAAYEMIMRQRLIRPMISGRKKFTDVSAAPAITSSRTWLAAVIACLLTIALVAALYRYT